MVRLGNIKYRMVTKKLKALGFTFYREGKGSHELWVNDKLNKVLPILKHSSRDFRIGTLRAIIRELNITVEEFLKL